MDWMTVIDGYCERTGPGFWAEPLNAWTNLLYIAGGLFMLWRCRRDGLWVATGLSLLLVAIGIGSFLFHTTARQWAATADTTPIGLFILLYLWAVMRHFLGWPLWVKVPVLFAFPLFVGAVVDVLGQMAFFRISAFYWSVPILLVGFSPLVARRDAKTAAGMLAGALLLSVSISVRSVDETLCDVWPVGTHFIWHMLNSILLPGMIELYRRHMLAARRARG